LTDNSTAIVDWSTFSRCRAELGPGFVRILGYFREDGEKSVAKLEAAAQARDAAALVMPAHTLKSEARQFGAEPLGDLAEEIEDAARRAVEQRAFPDEIIPTIAGLRPLYAQTLELFDQETNPIQSRRPGFGRASAANQGFGQL